MPVLARLIVAAGLIALATGLALPWATAQRDRLAPAACTVAPRAGDVAATPIAATPVAEPPEDASQGADGWIGNAAAELPPGEPADQETLAQITAAARELAGCLNAGDDARLAALLTDAALAAGVDRDDFTPLFAADIAEPGGSAVSWEIAWVRLREVRILPDGRVSAVVTWGVTDDPELKPLPEPNLHVYARVGDRWLLDAALRGAARYDEGGESAAGDVDPVLRRAPHGFAEVDSALYAEPTMAGAKFSIEALLMVGFVGDDEPGGVSCEMFIFERGEASATVSAFCRTEEALIGRAAYLRVQVYGPRRGSEDMPTMCEDVAPLAASQVFSCTADLSQIIS